jgi:hypothetical protein
MEYGIGDPLGSWTSTTVAKSRRSARTKSHYVGVIESTSMARIRLANRQFLQHLVCWGKIIPLSRPSTEAPPPGIEHSGRNYRELGMAPLERSSPTAIL